MTNEQREQMNVLEDAVFCLIRGKDIDLDAIKNKVKDAADIAEIDIDDDCLCLVACKLKERQ